MKRDFKNCIKNVEALYKKVKSLDITVVEMAHMAMGKVFNFADPEDYFSILENNNLTLQVGVIQSYELLWPFTIGVTFKSIFLA